jgi:hypothetical protein
MNYFKSKPAELPKTTILLDNGYQERETDSSLGADLSPDHD